MSIGKDLDFSEINKALIEGYKECLVAAEERRLARIENEKQINDVNGFYFMANPSTFNGDPILTLQNNNKKNNKNIIIKEYNSKITKKYK